MNRRKSLISLGVGIATLVVAPQLLFAESEKPTKVDRVKNFYDSVMPQLEPELRQYANGLDALLDNLYNLESNREIPEFVHQRVRNVFSGELSNIQEWNKKLFSDGLRAHYTAYTLQDFRNSKIAERLSSFYTALNEDEKNEFENRLRDFVPNQRTYEFLFRAGMKPMVFNPREVPGNIVQVDRPDWNHGIPYFRVSDPNGNHISAGVDESPSQYCEGNDNHVRDSNGNLIGYVNYFANVQPNFMFYDTKSKQESKNGNFFKTYLGAKGKMLWYKVGDLSDVREIPLTDRQIELLKNFFKWERPKVQSYK